MSKTSTPIPVGFEGATPYLTIKDADKAIDFYKQVFGAVEKKRFLGPNGKIFHAEIMIGQAHIFMSEENLEWGAKGPTTVGGSSTTTLLYFKDVDAIAAKATAAGANFSMPVADMFWGDRSGCFVDPFGHMWMISTHIEDVTDDEMNQRATAMFSGQPCQ